MLVTDGLSYLRIYWDDGTVGRKNMRFRNATTKPPVTGWGNVFVLLGEKYDTIFCPYSFEAVQAPKDCAELAKPVEPNEWRPQWWAEHLQRKWDSFQRCGSQVDYGVAALLFKALNMPVPVVSLKADGTEDTKRKGGKEEAEELIKPVKQSSKRGKVLAWMLAEGGGRKSMRMAMSELDMTLSNFQSHLHVIHKDHGIGYRIVGESAEIVLPTFMEKADDCWG